MLEFSEKKIILGSLSVLFILSIILIYLMLQKDINKKVIVNDTLQENLTRDQITNLPKVEIETSK